MGRNEDGDDSGWGSRVLRFDPRTMARPEWVGDESNPEIFESPRMFRHEQGASEFLGAQKKPKLDRMWLRKRFCLPFTNGAATGATHQPTRQNITFRQNLSTTTRTKKTWKILFLATMYTVLAAVYVM